MNYALVIGVILAIAIYHYVTGGGLQDYITWATDPSSPIIEQTP